MGGPPLPPLLGSLLAAVSDLGLPCCLPVFLIFIEYLEYLVIKLSDKQVGGFHVHFKLSLLSGSEGLVGLSWGVSAPHGPFEGSGRGWGSPARCYAAPSSWRRQGQSPASPQASEGVGDGGGEWRSGGAP